MSSRLRGFGRAGVAAAVTFAVDQATKQLVVSSFELGERENVFFAIDLHYVRNTGVAFGAFSGGGVAITIGTIVALALLLVYFAVNAQRRHLWLPVGAVVGGATGNLVDRLREGAVIDFIDPIAWPAFNLADAAIVLGVLGVLYLVEERVRQ